MITRFFAEVIAGEPSAEVERWMRDRGPAHLLERVRIPTLLIAGEQDTLFPLSQALANHAGLAGHLTGDRLRLLWFCGGHGTCKPSYMSEIAQWDRIPEEIVRWFQRWVREDETVAFPGRFSYMTQDGAWHDADRYPPAGVRTVRTVSTESRVIVANGEPAVGGGAEPAILLPLGGTGVPFSGTPLGQPPRAGLTTAKYPIPDVDGAIIGAPRLTITAVASGAGREPIPLYFRLVDRRTGEVLANQETVRTFTPDSVRRTVTFALEPLAWRGASEQDLALEIGSQSANFEPAHAAGIVSVGRIELALPVVGSGSSPGAAQ
jgi:ABC-2 type transport system ATP-binding protein